MKSILDRSFRYTPSSETDLRKTFARVKREQLKRNDQALANVFATGIADIIHIAAGKTKART